MSYMAFVLMMLLLTGCTYSVSLQHIEGSNDQAEDSAQATAEATVPLK